MRARKTSETRNVAASIAYVAPSPSVAISTPASAGPAICAALPRKPSSAEAAGSSSRGTSRGSIASSGGRWSPPAPAIPAATTNSTQTCGSSSSALARRISARTSSVASAMRTSRRRSWASASAPPSSAVNSSGTISARPIRPDQQRRARQVVDLERDRDVREHRPRERDRLADVEQPELAMPPEGTDVDGEAPEQATHGGHAAASLGARADRHAAPAPGRVDPARDPAAPAGEG